MTSFRAPFPLCTAKVREKTLEQMAPSGSKEKLIQLWTARLTRELKTDRARKWAEQVPKSSVYFPEIWQSIAMGYLKAGRFEEAKKITPKGVLF